MRRKRQNLKLKAYREFLHMCVVCGFLNRASVILKAQSDTYTRFVLVLKYFHVCFDYIFKKFDYELRL